MYKFWYDFVKSKYGKKLKLRYIDKDNLAVYIKANDVYKDIEKDIGSKFDTSNFKLECNSFDRPVLIEKNKKVIVLMKDTLCGKIMTKFVGLKNYNCLIDDGNEDKKEKNT